MWAKRGVRWGCSLKLEIDKQCLKVHKHAAKLKDPQVQKKTPGPFLPSPSSSKHARLDQIRTDQGGLHAGLVLQLQLKLQGLVQSNSGKLA